MRYILILLNFIPCILLAQEPDIQLMRLKVAHENEKVKLYIDLSNAYAQSQADSAVYYANEGMRLAERRKDSQGQASLLLALGHINTLHHHTGLARSFFNEALGLYRRLHDVAGIAHTYDQLGLLDGSQKEFGQALKYYQDSRDSSGLIETYENIGRSYQEKSELEKALSYYLRALAQYEHRKQEPEGYFVLLENIGKLYQQKGDSAMALRYLNEGIGKSTQQAVPRGEMLLLNDEAKVFSESHQQGKALAEYKQALAEAKRYRQPDEQAEALIGIAGILQKQDVKTSIKDLQQALDIAKGLHEANLEARIYDALGGVYRQQNNYGEAMTALQEQHRLVDSLLSADTVKDIAALDSSYQLERSHERTTDLEHTNKLETIALTLALVLAATVIIFLFLLAVYLRKVKGLNGELQHLNEELTNSNRVKDTLFSVIGHDLKGPAGSAAQLFELMETEEFSQTELRSMISELRKQTTASLQLLQALFEWGKAQLQGIRVTPVKFSPKAVLERCIDLLSVQAADKKIQVNNQITHGLQIHADRDHFEFVMRNLLSNAIKFTYNGGVISINSKVLHEKGEVMFAVKDNGIGISKAQQEIFATGNMQVSFGTQKEKGSGLGLLLTKDFIRANSGRIWLESEEGKGSTFFITLPAI